MGFFSDKKVFYSLATVDFSSAVYEWVELRKIQFVEWKVSFCEAAMQLQAGKTIKFTDEWKTRVARQHGSFWVSREEVRIFRPQILASVCFRDFKEKGMVRELMRGVSSHGLRSLRVCDWSGSCLTAADFANLNRSCPALRVLKLSGCSIPTETVVEETDSFWTVCRSLTALDVSHCRGLDGQFVHFSYRLRSLQDLNAGSTSLSDTDVVCITAHCEQLHTLSVEHCLDLTRLAIKAVACQCKTLTSLNMADTPGIAEQALLDICVATCKGYIKLNNLDVSSSSVHTTHHWPPFVFAAASLTLVGLKDFKFSHSFIGRAEVEWRVVKDLIADMFSQMTVLDLSSRRAQMSGVPLLDWTKPGMRDAKQLREASEALFEKSVADIASRASSRQRRHVHLPSYLSKCRGVDTLTVTADMPGRAFDYVVSQCASALRSLTFLSFSSLSSQNIRYLTTGCWRGRTSHLSVLKCCCSGFGDVGAEELSSLILASPLLTELGLKGSRVTNAVVDSVMTMRLQLAVLVLTECDITEKAVMRISKASFLWDSLVRLLVDKCHDVSRDQFQRLLHQNGHFKILADCVYADDPSYYENAM